MIAVTQFFFKLTNWVRKGKLHLFIIRGP